MSSRAYMPQAQTVEWETPQELFDQLNAEFCFDLDACATPENAKVGSYFTSDQDALKQDWTEYRAVYMNPPYGRKVERWVRKAYETAQTGKTLVVCLLPARTDTKWWHAFCLKAEVRFIRGRLSFGRGGRAPFPSVVVIFRRAGEDRDVKRGK